MRNDYIVFFNKFWNYNNITNFYLKKTTFNRRRQASDVIFYFSTRLLADMTTHAIPCGQQRLAWLEGLDRLDSCRTVESCGVWLVIIEVRFVLFYRKYSSAFPDLSTNLDKQTVILQLKLNNSSVSFHCEQPLTSNSKPKCEVEEQLSFNWVAHHINACGTQCPKTGLKGSVSVYYQDLFF